MSTERIALLEELLAKAYASLDHSSRNDELRKEIEAALPPADQLLHASNWRGETRCELRLGNKVPRPLLADVVKNVTCPRCLQNWIDEHRERALDLDRAVLGALDQLEKVQRNLTPIPEAT